MPWLIVSRRELELTWSGLQLLRDKVHSHDNAAMTSLDTRKLIEEQRKLDQYIDRVHRLRDESVTTTGETDEQREIASR